MTTHSASACNVRPAVAVHATVLGADLRSALRSLGYTPVAVRESMEWIEDHGTATGCDSIDPADLAPLDELIRQHTGNIECDPADWPAAWDEHVWTLDDNDDDEPAAAVPSDAGPFTEPSLADRLWLASDGQVNLFGAELAPICGGSPEPAGYTVALEGKRWVLRLDGRAVFQSPSEADVRDELARRSSVRSQPMRGYTDEDACLCGACG